MSALPPGWAWAKLREIAEIVGGITKDAKKQSIADEEVPYLRVANVQRGYLDLREVKTIRVAASRLPELLLKPGDVLFNEGGDLDKLGRGWVWEGQIAKCTFQNHVFRARLHGGLNQPKIISWWGNLSGPNFFLRAGKQTTNLASISKAMLCDFPVLLPPVAEQERLVSKLDALLGRIDVCRERLDLVPGILKRFRQSVLAAATSGRLTEDWRAARGQASDWQELRLAEIATIQGGVTKDAKKQSAADEEVPYLRVANVQRGYLDLSEIKTIRIPSNRLEELLLEPGDILFNEGGDIDKLGRGWIWEGQIERCSFQNHVFRARLRNKANQPKYISWWGNFRGLEFFLRAGKQTTNLASINKSTLSELPISLPPPAEQEEIVRRVEQLFAYADRLEARVAAARAQVERLSPALLAKAFRGELVPQDPNDESAEVLLEHLRAQNAEAPKRRGRAAQRAASP